MDANTLEALELLKVGLALTDEKSNILRKQMGVLRASRDRVDHRVTLIQDQVRLLRERVELLETQREGRKDR